MTPYLLKWIVYTQEQHEQTTLKGTLEKRLAMRRWRRQGDEHRMYEYAFDQWRACMKPKNEPPTWLCNAETTLSNVPTYHTRFIHDSHDVFTVHGIVSPPLIDVLAVNGTTHHLPTLEGSRITLSRVRSDVMIGTYIVDVTSWDATHASYVVRPRTPPERRVNVFALERRRQFSRR